MLVIPAIDLIGAKCVRLYQGDYERQTVFAEEPVEQALRFQAVGFRRIHLVDLEGARDGRGRNREAIKRVLSGVAVPVQVGGGIRTAEDVEQLLAWGASRLILGTVALKKPEEVSEWMQRWGAEPFMISLDVRRGQLRVEGWLEGCAVSLDEMICRIADWRVREVICTDIERDGAMEQPNFASIADLLVRLPEEVDLIAAGGVSSPAHIAELRSLGAAGAVVGRALYENLAALEEFVHAG
jgi:phosphoribosylformimino-5-aminoimidazole carboxamide ribotide isomerase